MKRIHVEHETIYTYESEVQLAHHLAYLSPITNSYQEVLSSHINISPAPDTHQQNLDIFGNKRDFFSFHKSHQSLSVTSTSEVISKSIPSDLIQRIDHTWEVIRDSLKYSASKSFLSASEFTYPSPFAPYTKEIKNYAEKSFTPGRKLTDASIELCGRIFKDFKYSPNSTEINTPVWQAFETKKGVCQDFAHIFIVALRSIGLSAKYISGYLLTTPPPGQEKLRGADASHAWISIYCPGIPGDWLELDPTNNMIADSNHVRLAIGRDFGDVSPLRGVIRGGGDHELSVAVTAEEIDPQQLRIQKESTH
jgi:transglutaminase-like putative cysteine protease